MPQQTPAVPDDVQAVIDSDTKATSRDRFRKLLRDAYYAGPISRGSSPERSTGANTASPGSGLRRSRDGALWNLTQQQENILLDEAADLDLIDENQGKFFTTSRGVDVLKALDRCDDCGSLKKPHYEERTVKISRWSSGKNHSLITKCTDCDDGPYNWDRDHFPPTRSNTDDAERIARSIEHAQLYDAGIGEWMEPELRALNEFIDMVREETYSFDSFLNRYSTPNRLPNAGSALRTIFNDYSGDVCEDFADLLLKTYYGACLTDAERGIIEHVAAGCPDMREATNFEHHAQEYLEPLAVVEGDEWEATLRFEATGTYVTISGIADRTHAKFDYETKSGLSLSASRSAFGSVIGHPLPDELRHDTGDLATVVAFEVKDEPTYPAESRVEQAFEAITRGIEPDERKNSKLKKNFNTVQRGRKLNVGALSSTGETYELNESELVKLARRIEDWTESDDVPSLIERFAGRPLTSDNDEAE